MKSILKYSLFIFSGILLFTIVGCKKEGTGGNSTVDGYVKHHNKLIPNAEVYIKYGYTEFPGNDVSNYDAHIMADTNAHYEITDLQKGDYYLYAVGYDNNIAESVTGGVAVTLKRNKTSTIDVPVSESH